MAIRHRIVVQLADCAAARAEFGLDTAVNASTTDGAGNNRNVAPSTITFESTGKDTPGGNLDIGDAIRVWVLLDVGAGDPAQDSYYEIEVEGNSTE